MGTERFDAWARRLAARRSRRRVIGRFGAIALGTIGFAAAADDTMARPAICRPGGRYCTRGQQCCSTRCRTGKRVPIASRNICECEAPLTLCGRTCRDLDADPNHCGGCGAKIDRDTHLCCDGAPVAIGNDNCGACGNACEPGVDCIDNRCGLPPVTSCEVVDPWYYCWVTTEGLLYESTCYQSQFVPPTTDQLYPCESSADCYRDIPDCQTAAAPWECICAKHMDGEDVSPVCYYLVDHHEGGICPG